MIVEEGFSTFLFYSRFFNPSGLLQSMERWKMKKRVQKLTDEELIGYPIRDLVEGWFFRVDEVSQGFYQVEGIDRWGRKVSRMGVDPEQLLSLCKSDIEAMAFT